MGGAVPKKADSRMWCCGRELEEKTTPLVASSRVSSHRVLCNQGQSGKEGARSAVDANIHCRQNKGAEE